MVKYLQRVPLDVPINWCYPHQNSGERLFRNIKDEIILEASKTIISRLMKKKGKIVCLTKEKYLTTNKEEEKENIFVKRVMEKQVFHHPLTRR